MLFEQAEKKKNTTQKTPHKKHHTKDIQTPQWTHPSITNVSAIAIANYQLQTYAENKREHTNTRWVWHAYENSSSFDTYGMLSHSALWNDTEGYSLFFFVL